MNKFWNESVESVMSNNGTNEAAIENQWQLHDAGRCGGYSGFNNGEAGCPICTRIYKAETASIVAQRNARLASKA